jgi:hypothetical protein
VSVFERERERGWRGGQETHCEGWGEEREINRGDIGVAGCEVRSSCQLESLGGLEVEDLEFRVEGRWPRHVGQREGQGSRPP